MTIPQERLRIGILVPSSNTALEPLTTLLLFSIPNISVHFSRFRVTTIGLASSALAQFDIPKIVEAAQLLADAEVDVIGWSGTSAGWLGFEADEKLCRAIEEETGIKATTSTLALNKALALLGVRRLGLVTPYTQDVQDAIIKNYAGIGVDVVAERHLSRTDNVNFATLGLETFDPMVEEVVGGGGKVDAVTTFCTNLRTADLVQGWEEKWGVPVLDSVVTVVWECLRMCGFDTKQLNGWGKIMQL